MKILALTRPIFLIPPLCALFVVLCPSSPRAQPPAVRFTDATAKAKLAFRHESGGIGLKYYPETFGSGVCVIDADQDGWADLFFVNGRAWTAEEAKAAKVKAKPPRRTSGPSLPALYRNNRDGTFADVTKRAGLAFESYGMGCAVGDYDNDGAPDLVITGYGQARLYRNSGKQRFVDVTREVGLDDRGWSTCALWFDYDHDGDLDLFICHYVQWTPQTDLVCGLSGDTKLFCGPDPYRGESNRLYRNELREGRRLFTDVTEAAGLMNPRGKTLGAALLDYDGDDWLDLVVANDQAPNFLYRNKGDGAFADESVKLGLSVGRFGVAKAGMGIDVADPLNDGAVGILVGNFAREGLTLHMADRPAARPSGQPLPPLSPAVVFKDQAPRLGLTQPSLPFLTFGVAFFDADLDGRLDIVAANGHIDEELVNFLERNIPYRQRPLLFLAGSGERSQYKETGESAGLSRTMVGRGVAYLDYDRDGDLDLVFTDNGGSARLYRNEGKPANHWLRISLIGAQSNRDAVGAVVSVTANGMTQRRMVKTGSSYLSQSELTLTFGLGGAKTVERLEIRWPSGRMQTLEKVAANQQVVITEK